MAEIGFIGTGVMGGEMVSRLSGRGHVVQGHNRTRSKGMKWAEHPQAVAWAARVIPSLPGY